MVDIKKLREEGSKLHAEASEFNLKFSGEVVATPEDIAAQDARIAKVEAIAKQLNDAEKLAKLSFASPDKSVTVEGNTAKAQVLAKEFKDNAGGEEMSFSEALNNWAFSGNMEASFATVTTATSSAILLDSVAEKAQLNYAPNSYREALAAYGLTARQTPGDTSAKKVIVLNPVAGGLVAETANSETANNTSFTDSYTVTPATYQSGTHWQSGLSFLANGTDFANDILPAQYANKELGLESAITAAIIADSGLSAIRTSTTTGIDYASLPLLNNSLGKRFQRMKVILLGAAAYSYVEGLVDGQNRPVMTPDAQNQSLMKIGGTPVIRCDYFEGMTANKIIGAIVSLVGFQLRDCGSGTGRYNNSALPDQVGVNTFGYHGYGWSVGAVVKFGTKVS